MVYVGIDPAFRKKGFAICIVDEEKTVRFITFKTFLDFVSWIIYERPEVCVFCVENSNLQSGIWQKGMKGAESVGKNKAISQCTYDLCCVYGKTYGISPRDKGAKPSDDDCKLYFQIQGWQPTEIKNQDERDALKIAYIGAKKYIFESKVKG